MRHKIIPFISNSLRKQFVLGLIIICSFFIVTMAVNRTFRALLYASKPSVQVPTKKRLLIDIYYKNPVAIKNLASKNLKYSTINNEIRNELRHVKGVEACSFTEKTVNMNLFTPSDLRSETEIGFLCDYNLDKVFGFVLEEGRWFEKSDYSADMPPVVLTKSHARQLGIEKLEPNSLFHFKSSRYDIKLKVVGIIKDPGELNETYRKYHFFAPRMVSNETSARGAYCNIKLTDDADRDEIIGEISDLFKSKGWNKKFIRFQVDSLKELMHQKVIEHLQSYNIEYAIMLMVLCFLTVIISGSCWRQVKERINELAIRRAVGASRGRIIQLILLEKLTFFSLYMFVAFLIYLNVYKSLGIQSYIQSPLISSGSILVIILIASLIPAVQASSIRPVKALAEE